MVDQIRINNMQMPNSNSVLFEAIQKINKIPEQDKSSPDLNILNDMIANDESRKSYSINKNSKKIRKDKCSGSETESDASMINRGNEKIQDKGDYYILHLLNSQTKRMNQIL
jgi:hypothetical protein